MCRADESVEPTRQVGGNKAREQHRPDHRQFGRKLTLDVMRVVAQRDGRSMSLMQPLTMHQIDTGLRDVWRKHCLFFDRLKSKSLASG